MIAGNLTSPKVSPRPLQLGLLDRCARSFLFGILARIEHGQITLRGDGHHTFGLARSPAEFRATVDVCSGRLYRELTTGGSLAAAESYLRGHWQCDDLTALLRLAIRNRDQLAGLERVSSRVRAPLERLWRRTRANSRRGSRQNIAAHYDLGNDFFALFLDETLSYSCGVFPSPTASLAAASHAKNDLVCRKLALSPRDHVLEIGTGWGGFALHAARNYGCRVTTTTISRQQYEAARRRVAAAGLDHRVTVLLEDYRQLAGSFDKLVSIEMIEAVGYDYLDEYLRCCRRLLKPAGLLLLQAILMSDQNFAAYRREVDFIQRYIFPGGFLPSLGAIADSVRRSTDFGLVHYEDITAHYPPTLRAWRDRFDQSADELTALGYPERFQRMWHYYFSYCEAGFLERHVTCAQLMFTGPQGTWHTETNQIAQEIQDK